MRRCDVCFGSKAASQAYSSSAAAFGVKRTLKRGESGSFERLLSAKSGHSPDQIYGFDNEVGASNKSIIELDSISFGHPANDILSVLFQKVMGGCTPLILRPHRPLVHQTRIRPEYWQDFGGGQCAKFDS
jgi:hypothetical protein